MNIKDYSYIVEIANQKNLTAAAERLCITQSALTKFVHRVEQELGTPLFYRRGKRFVLTPIGRVYVEKGEEIIRVDQTLRDEIHKMKINGADTIRLGYGAGFAEFIMDHLLPAYFALPHTRSISVQEGASSRLIQNVEKGELDLCLAYAKTHRPGLNYTPLRHTQLVLAVPEQSHLLAAAEPREDFPYPVLEETNWLREPYIYLSAFTQSGSAAFRYFSQLGSWPNSRLYVRDVRGALNAVAHGLGNCIVMEPPYVKAGIRLLCLPLLAQPEEEIYMVTLKGVYFDQSLAKLQEIIKKLYGYSE